MSGWEILDLAMSFTYLLPNLICSPFNELLEHRLQNRATVQERVLCDLRYDAWVQPGQESVRKYDA
jgi:hypothetical protein